MVLSRWALLTEGHDYGSSEENRLLLSEWPCQPLRRSRQPRSRDQSIETQRASLLRERALHGSQSLFLLGVKPFIVTSQSIVEVDD